MSIETAATSPSVADYRPPSAQPPKDQDITEEDVQMHPCEAKKTGTSAPTATTEQWQALRKDDESSESEDDVGEYADDGPRASHLIQNSSYWEELFDFPPLTREVPTAPTYFRKIRLPNQINLRNLSIQPIKYATISDLVMYAKDGISAGVVQAAEMMVQAQELLYQERMAQWYADAHVRGVTGQGEGLDRPVKYGVWIIKEPFTAIEKFAPHLIQLDSRARRPRLGKAYHLLEREVCEAAEMTRASEVCPNFWVGNDMDVPGSEGDGAWYHHRFDLCVMASELNDMPLEMDYPRCLQKLAEIRKSNQAKEAERQQLDKDKEKEKESTNSPATVALRNILSPFPRPPPSPKGKDKLLKSPEPSGRNLDGNKRGPSDSRDDLAQFPASKNRRPCGKWPKRGQIAAARYPYCTLRCAGSSRNMFGQMRNQGVMMDKILSLVAFLRAIAEGRDPHNPDTEPDASKQHKVLVHCHDGYTESTILVLTYVMYTLELTLPEAFLHLQVNSKRSFFLYPVDKPLLKRLDNKLQQDRRTARMRKAAAAAAEKEQAAKGAGRTTPVPEKNSASPASPSSSGTSRWKSWGFRSSSSNSDKTKDGDGRPERRTRKESSSSMASMSSASSATAVADSGQSTPTTESAAGNGNRRWSRESRGRDAKSKGPVPSNEPVAKQEDAVVDAQGGNDPERLNKPVEEELPQHVQDMKLWFMDKRFEGFPSRILPFLYLGNM
jgi:dual specificity MAP kinase phosphatase